MSTNAQVSGRLDFIDAHRGLAVVLMLWMHTADGWLQPGLKQGAAWGWVRSVGGLAAPTFLFLAGVSVSLSWASRATPAQRRSGIARGLQLVVLGYALRLQMWMLDAGGVRHAVCWAAALPLLVSYVAAHRGLSAWARSAPGARKLGQLALGTWLLGMAIVSMEIHDRLLPLLRVDILQAIGASLACISLLGEPLRVRPWLGVVLGVGVALLTPWFRAWVPGPVPIPFAGYLAAWDTPSGQLAPTLFPLFPWFAYALIGTSVGLRLGTSERRRGSGKQEALLLAAVGVGLAVATCEALRPAHLLIATWPLATQPMRVAYRAGASLALGGLAVGFSDRRMPTRGPLVTIGRASLFVYWIHLELAFGSLSRPLARKLDYAEWGFGLAILAITMTALAALWSRFRVRLSPSSARAASSPTQAGGEPARLGST